VPTAEAAAAAATAAAAAAAAIGGISRAAAQAAEESDEEEDAAGEGTAGASRRLTKAQIKQFKARYAAYLRRKEQEEAAAEQGVQLPVGSGMQEHLYKTEQQAHQPAQKRAKHANSGERKRAGSSGADADTLEVDCLGNADSGLNESSKSGSESEGDDSDAEMAAEGEQQQQPRQSLRQRMAAAAAMAAAALPSASQIAAAAAGASTDAATGDAAQLAAAGSSRGLTGAFSHMLKTANDLVAGLSGHPAPAAAAAAGAGPFRVGPGRSALQQQEAAAAGAAAAAVGAAAAAGAAAMAIVEEGVKDNSDLPAHWNINPYMTAGKLHLSFIL
jgi:hypothetical protein